MKSIGIKTKLLAVAVTGLALVGVIFTGCNGYTPSTSTPDQTAVNTIPQTSSPPLTIPSKTTPSTVAAVKDESLSVSLDKQQVKPGDTFTISVLVNSKIASRGAQASLSFDPSAMECVGVSEGNFFKDWAAANGITTTMMPSEAAIDNTQGTVDTVAIIIMGQTAAEQSGKDAGGAQGQGTLLTFKMTAKSGNGKPTVINVSNVILLDSNGDPINGVDAVNGQVTIGTP